jgi:hypothetical protein
VRPISEFNWNQIPDIHGNEFDILLIALYHGWFLCFRLFSHRLTMPYNLHDLTMDYDAGVQSDELGHP